MGGESTVPSSDMTAKITLDGVSSTVITTEPFSVTPGSDYYMVCRMMAGSSVVNCISHLNFYDADDVLLGSGADFDNAVEPGYWGSLYADGASPDGSVSARSVIEIDPNIEADAGDVIYLGLIQISSSGYSFLARKTLTGLIPGVCYEVAVNVSADGPYGFAFKLDDDTEPVASSGWSSGAPFPAERLWFVFQADSSEREIALLGGID